MALARKKKLKFESFVSGIYMDPGAEIVTIVTNKNLTTFDILKESCSQKETIT